MEKSRPGPVYYDERVKYSVSEYVTIRVLINSYSGVTTVLTGTKFHTVFFYLLRCPTSYERARNTSLHHKLTRAIMHISCLEAQTILNTYNLWKLALRGHLNIDDRMRYRTQNFLITRKMPYPLSYCGSKVIDTPCSVPFKVDENAHVSIKKMKEKYSVIFIVNRYIR